MFEFTARHFARSRHVTGITPIELLLKIARLRIQTAVAASGFAEVLRLQRVKSVREAMIASKALARMEAITRGQPVMLPRTWLPGHGPGARADRREVC